MLGFPSNDVIIIYLENLLDYLMNNLTTMHHVFLGYGCLPSKSGFPLINSFAILNVPILNFSMDYHFNSGVRRTIAAIR